MEASEAGRYWEGNAETWTRHVRAGRDVYRDALNSPAFLAMLPPIEGLQGLDIGCGEGTNTRAVARLGARMQGIDIAPTFIRHAQSAEGAEPLGIAYRAADAAALPFEAGAFDFATAFMSLMDMPDAGRVLAEARRVLKPGGFLQFSILHPCFVPPHRKVLRDAKGDAWAVEVGGYFGAADGMVQQWQFETLSAEERAGSRPFQTPRFHRTLSQWVDALGQAGLAIEHLAEPCASLELAAAEPIVADTRTAPLALIVRARPSACLDPPDPRP